MPRSTEDWIWAAFYILAAWGQIYAITLMTANACGWTLARYERDEKRVAALLSFILSLPAVALILWAADNG